MADNEIVVLGAGIVGLYTALVLSRQGHATKITVLAKHLPGDQSIDYTSPTAGANFSGISGDDPAALEYDRISFLELDALFRDYGERAGLKRLPAIELFGVKPAEAKLASLREYIPDFEEITDESYLASKGAVFGVRYTSYNFYAPQFLRFLHDHLARLGVTFLRGHVSHIRKAFLGHGTKVVFNCSGNLASKLGGVNDTNCYPIRGQVLVVKAPHINSNYSFFTPGNPPTYIIPRPHSGGRVILGGFYQEGNWTADTFAHESASILDRTTRLLPELLANGPLEVLDERAGLRPGRKGGARIEKEYIDGKLVIHNYGAAGTGYQSGLGMALKAVSLYTPKSKSKL